MDSVKQLQPPNKSIPSLINQQVKIRSPIIKLFETLIFTVYILMTFFKQPLLQSMNNVTFTIGAIPYRPYIIIEIILMCFLLISKIYYSYTHKVVNTCRLIIVTICVLIVIIFNIRQLNENVKFSVGLIIRPIFITFYNEVALHAMKKYVNIFLRCIKLIIAMWFFLLIFASIGVKLFNNVKFDGTQNIFQNLWEAIFNILVMQTTANYPDVGLPYYGNAKSNILYFIIVIIVNTMLISNLIVATNYTNYKQIAEVQQDEESIINLLYQYTSIIVVKNEQNEMKNNLSPLEQKIISITSSQFIKIIFLTTSIIMFFVICFVDSSTAFLGQSIVLWILFLVNFAAKFSEFIIYKIFFWRLHLFEIYQIVASFISILIFFLAISDVVPYKQYSKFVIILMSMNIKYFLQYIVPKAQSLINFLKRFKEIAIMLFLISLMFAGIGQILFGGFYNQNQALQFQQNGINPDYVYVNFHNTLNSFTTLIALLMVNNWNMITNTYCFLYHSNLVRIYFILYYTFGVQIAYNLVLASIIEHIVNQTEKIKNIENYNQKHQYKHYLINKKFIVKIRDLLINSFRKIYKNHKQVFETALCQYQWNFPAGIISNQLANYRQNLYTLMYFSSSDKDFTFEASTKIQSKTLIQPLLTINIEKILKQFDQIKNIKFQTYSVKKMLQQQGITLEVDYTQFLILINAKLKQYGLSPKWKSNKVYYLIEYLIQRSQIQSIFYLKYDLPQQFQIQNLVDVYINKDRVASSFQSVHDNTTYLIQKIQINKIAYYFGEFIHKKQQEEQIIIESIIQIK